MDLMEVKGLISVCVLFHLLLNVDCENHTKLGLRVLILGKSRPWRKRRG